MTEEQVRALDLALELLSCRDWKTPLQRCSKEDSELFLRAVGNGDWERARAIVVRDAILRENFFAPIATL